jgi:hypothetical protein
MSKVYLSIPRAIDEKLGHVDEDGVVYRSKPGLDQRMGRVDLSNGKIYQDRFGLDKWIGHVDMRNGKVYRNRFGPDEHVGHVDKDGRFYKNIRFGFDEQIGYIDQFISYAHAAAGMLLLILPEIKERNQPDENS